MTGLFSRIGASALVAGGISGMNLRAAEAPESELIKEGMKTLHKGENSLLKSVLEGKGTDEEIQKLQTFYRSLPASRPPLGQEDSWKEKSAALIKAIDAVAEKKPEGVSMLKEATNCKACHSLHKPK